MDIKSDLHTHSLFSDGSASIDSMVRTAAEKGLTTIAVTDHMPLPYKTRYAMDMDEISIYRKEILAAQQRYGDRIKVLAGIEIEYSPELSEWIQSLAEMDWDYQIASVHTLFVGGRPYLVNGNRQEFDEGLSQAFRGDIRALCGRYFSSLKKAAATGWFDTAGHLDVVKKHNDGFFKETDPWYRAMVMETLEILKDQNMKMEINTSGLLQFPQVQYPSAWIIQEAVQMGIPLVFGSDSHRPETLGHSFQSLSVSLFPPSEKTAMPSCGRIS